MLHLASNVHRIIGKQDRKSKEKKTIKCCVSTHTYKSVLNSSVQNKTKQNKTIIIGPKKCRCLPQPAYRMRIPVQLPGTTTNFGRYCPLTSRKALPTSSTGWYWIVTNEMSDWNQSLNTVSQLSQDGEELVWLSMTRVRIKKGYNVSVSRRRNEHAQLYRYKKKDVSSRNNTQKTLMVIDGLST